MGTIIAFGLLLAAPAAANPVSVAAGDWSNIPLAQQSGTLRVSTLTVNRIDAALNGQCSGGQPARKAFNLSVPFLIEFSPDGGVKQIVVQKLDCPAAESALGGALLELARSGEYRPTGENQTGWYRGEFQLESR